MSHPYAVGCAFAMLVKEAAQLFLVALQGHRHQVWRPMLRPLHTNRTLVLVHSLPKGQLHTRLLPRQVSNPPHPSWSPIAAWMT